MTIVPRPGTRATIIWSALVVLLLALAGPLGAATTDAVIPGASAAATQHHAATPAGDRVVAATSDCPAHGAQHEAEMLGVLCLSAPLVNGVAAIVPGAWTHRGLSPAPAAGDSQWMRAHSLAHTAGHDPVLRGISRT
jgi:hypothetical protein